jgi:hypothetical protein
MDFVVARVAEADTKARPWFQGDRGADFWDLLTWASDHHSQAWVTVRCKIDRKLEPGGRVRQALGQRPVLGRKEVEIPALGSRQARTAQVEIRAAPVVVTSKQRSGRAPLGVVWVHEVGPVPEGQARLDWVLWTTYPIRTLQAVLTVVTSYEHRWVIEEFHKTWKSVCGVEKTQLRSLHALQVWATLLAMAAVRIQRLLKRARENPTAPASSEFSDLELQALLLHAPGLRKPKSAPTLAAAVEAIATLGGYTGKSSGGPPGPITLGRGLEDLRVATATIDVLIRTGRLNL